MQAHEETFLKHLLAQPAAPYREIHSEAAVIEELERHAVPWFRDPIGNLVLGAASRAEYRKLLARAEREPLRLFIAHLDHPGFHGVRWRSPTELEVKWYGGSPVEHLEGAPLWLADRHGWAAEATLHEAKIAAHGKAMDTAVARLAAPIADAGKAETYFGAFRFRAPVWQEGELLYTKAADDLVGSFVITRLAIEHFGRVTAQAGVRGRKKSAPRKAAKRAPFLGLLTRAEETGFIGAIAHFELGWHRGAKRRLLAVSLETSRQLPNAEVGKGPIVRLGDRNTVFHPGALQVLAQVAERALPQKHQKRIMDGGACEATAATVFGIDAIGISVPLGNYHNQSFEGGPDARGPMGPAPEFVHLHDVDGMLTLVRELVKPGLPWADPWAEKRKLFRKWHREAKKLLKG
jgi:putative aminopeptidase FrvX